LPCWRPFQPPFAPCEWTSGEASRADYRGIDPAGVNPVLPHGLNLGLGEQSVQELLAAPLVTAKPSNKPLLALVLEANHEEPVRTVDGRRHDLERRDLRGIPDASLPIMIFDGSLGSLAREWARHVT